MVDETYDQLRAAHGNASPKASGYLSEYAFARERSLVLEAIGSGRGTIVDVGCGGGLVTAPLAAAGRRVVGVDFNAAACRQARRNGLAAIRGDAFKLPLAAGTAAVVLNVEFAQQHEPARVAHMLQEARRVLRVDGRLVVVWSNRRALPHRLAQTLLDGLDRRRGRGALASVHHTVAAMRRMAEQAGFRADDAFAIFPPLGWRLPRADGALASLLGTSFVAIFETRSSA